MDEKQGNQGNPGDKGDQGKPGEPVRETVVVEPLRNNPLRQGGVGH